jgi:hypothetical protein
MFLRWSDGYETSPMNDLGQYLGFVWWFLTLLLGALLSLLFVLFVEKWRKPALTLTIEHTPPLRPDGRKFLRVLVRNKPVGKLLSFFTTRQPALMCKAHLLFLNEDDTPRYANERKMVGRWSSTPEPIVPQIIGDDQGRPQIAFLGDPTKATDCVDIPPNEEEVLDVLMKEDGQSCCYGWHNGIIGHHNPPSNQTFELPKGRYHVLITVRTCGEDFSKLFRIVNDPQDITEFRLEEIK